MDDTSAIDAKIAAAEARVDAKLADQRGETRLLSAEISTKLDKVLTAMVGFEGRLTGFEGKLSEFDRKLTQQGVDLDRKLAEQRADLDRKLAEQHADLDRKLTEQRADLDRKLTEQRTDLEKKLTEQRSDFKADFRANRTLMVGLAVSVSALMLAIVLAVFTVGNTMFSRGIVMRDVVKAVIAEQQAATGSARPNSP